MEKKQKLNMKPEELVALASSLAITIANNFCFADMCALRMFFATVSSNIALIEFQSKNCKTTEIKKDN